MRSPNHSRWKRKGKDVSYRGLYHRYKCNAKLTNREFTLTFDEVKTLVSLNCFYCDIEPRQFYNPYLTKTGEMRQLKRFMFKDYVDTLTILHNGIDRKNNDLGYTTENSVSCCWLCNETKHHNFTYDEFLKIGKVIKEIRHIRGGGSCSS